jgi:hypothetical protein
MDPRVVADVDDGGELVYAGIRGLLRKLTQPEQLLNPQQEPGAANPTDQNRDLHLTFTGLDSTARVGTVIDTPTPAKQRKRRNLVTRWYGNSPLRLTRQVNKCLITSVSFPGWPADSGVADRDSITCSNCLYIRTVATHSLSQITPEEADEACLMSTFGAL